MVSTRKGVITAALGLALLALPALTGTGVAQARVTLQGSRPAWAGKATSAGSVPAGSKVSVRVYLAPKGGSRALARAVASVSTPGSAQYRHFITPAQYRARYAPTPEEVAAVSAWLRTSGMRVSGIAFANRYVAAAGTAASAEQAFGVRLNLYRLHGRLVRSPSADASVPASLGSSVLGVTGLDTSPGGMRPALVSPGASPRGFRNATPCSSYYGELTAQYEADGTTPLPQFDGSTPDYAICGYTPSQFRSAYGVTASGLTGAGVTVAITDAYKSPTLLSDANRYATDHGDSAFAPGQFTESLPTKPIKHSGTSWYAEQSLDVEAVHGMAPDADVIFYAARSPSDADLLDALTRVVDDDQASMVSNSWYSPEMDHPNWDPAYEQVFEQGALQGIGFMFCSGDFGDELADTGSIQTDYPASDPYVTAVGGTSTEIDSSGNLAGQTGWGSDHYAPSTDGTSWDPIGSDPFAYGAGGGYSGLFGEPSYQDGVVPGTPSGRAVPDVAMDADITTGMLIGLTQKFPGGPAYGTWRIGGTSLSTPLVAGMQADATQAAGGRLGFANPAIYSLAASGDFTDVLPVSDANVRVDYVNGFSKKKGVEYTLETFDDDSSLTTAPGWDDVTGIGSPNEGYLFAFVPHA